MRIVIRDLDGGKIMETTLKRFEAEFFSDRELMVGCNRLRNGANHFTCGGIFVARLHMQYSNKGNLEQQKPARVAERENSYAQQ